MLKYITGFVLLITISLLFHVHASAAASELVLNQQKTDYRLVETMGVLADPKKKYTIADMRNDTTLEFLPANGKTSYGYSAAVYWIKFTLTNETEYEDWMVQLGNPFFDRVSFFSPQTDGSYAESTAIISQHTYLKEINHRYFVFKAHLPRGESRTFYMRAETNSYAIFLPITLWEKKHFESKNNQELLLIGGYYGIILVMLLYNLFLLFSLRLKSYLYYVLYVLVYAFLQFFWLGHGYQYMHFLMPYLPDSLLSVLGNLSLFLGFIFIIDILRPKQYNHVLSRLLQVCSGTSLLVFVLSLLSSNESWISKLLIFHPFLMFPVIIFSTLYCWIKGSRQAKFMFFGWIIMMLGSSASLLMSYGFLPEGLLTTYGMTMGSAMEVMLFSFALANRVQMLRLDHDRAQLYLFETQRRYAEDLRETVEKRTAELQSSNEKLMITERERQRLLANVSHDLRTPLTLVQGILESLSTNLIKDKPTIRKYSGIAYNRVLGINRLIDDLTELSHLEVKQVPFYFKPVLVRELEEDLLRSYKNEVELAGLSFEVVSEEKVRLKALMIDTDRMKQVFYNLLSNSMKHTPSGGEIRLSTICEEDQVLITLSDTGAGISEEDLPHIFDRFYQGSHEQEGMGLGLSIVKEIVRQHHGQISVTRLQKGTAFTIKLPVSYENKA